MCFGLVRKDYKILFRQNFGTFFAQMLFILVLISANMGIMGYCVMAAGAGWAMLMTISIAEQQSQAIAYLISTPYSRLKIIISKYISTILLFLGVTVFYGIISELTQQMGVVLFPRLTLAVVVMTFISYMLFVSITLPLYFFLTDMTVRLISLGLILGTCLVVTVIMKELGIAAVGALTAGLPDWWMSAGLAAAGIATVISIIVVKLAFDKLEF